MAIESERIIESLRSHKLIDGLTHNLYSYPARFSPGLAKEIIHAFSNPNDWVFDPFMGGGTAIVEALAAGRGGLGVDINSLAWFVALSKTTPLSQVDQSQLRGWQAGIRSIPMEAYPSLRVDEFRNHFSKPFLKYLDSVLETTGELDTKAAKRLSRFVLMKVYQNALNNSDGLIAAREIKKRIGIELEKTLAGIDDFLEVCHKAGIAKRELVSKRRLFNRSVIGIETDYAIKHLIGVPKLVFTSPPYPGVHVLYNKWQIRSRKETFLPYYISGMNYLPSEHYYTFGGRSKAGVERYFELVTQSFASISKVVHPQAIIVQLVGFSNSDVQLPLYLKAMEKAALKEFFPLSAEGKRLWRDVPNRKWYTNIGNKWDASREVLLFHRLDDTKQRG